MAECVREVMTRDPEALPASATILDAARRMRDCDIGDVIVRDNGSVRGVVTDRDLVVRALADGRTDATLGEIATTEVVTVGPDDPVADAIRMMRERAIRRLPVVEDGTLVGVVSIGDLALEQDPESALADISAAPPNQ
jgi:CBS domain-containing protein